MTAEQGFAPGATVPINGPGATRTPLPSAIPPEQLQQLSQLLEHVFANGAKTFAQQFIDAAAPKIAQAVRSDMASFAQGLMPHLGTEMHKIVGNAVVSSVGEQANMFMIPVVVDETIDEFGNKRQKQTTPAQILQDIKEGLDDIWAELSPEDDEDQDEPPFRRPQPVKPVKPRRNNGRG